MVYLHKKSYRLFDWISHWQRGDADTTKCTNVGEQHGQNETAYQHGQQNQSATEYNIIHYDNDSDSLTKTAPLDIVMNPGMTSPPPSPHSSFTRRNTKGSILDLLHRRKSSAASITSIQPRSSPPAGRKPAYSAIVLPSPSCVSSSTDSARRPQSIDNLDINDTPSSLDPALHSTRLGEVTISPYTSLSTHQHAIETNHNTIIPLPRIMSACEYQHYPSSNTPPISHLPRLYEALLKHGTPFSEHTIDMEDNLPPTANDIKKRITLNHDLMKLALDGLFKSPLDPNREDERQILQIGCGDGAWSIDCARASSQWFVLGLDNKEGGDLISTGLAKKTMLSGTPAMSQPPSSSGAHHGNNFLFMRSTLSLVESLKRLPDGCFDLVYGRFLALALAPNDYEALVSECWRVCKPGGFVEFTELDMRIYECTGNSQLINWVNQQAVSAMKNMKLDPRLPRHLQDQFFKLLVDDQPNSSRKRQDSYHVSYTSLPLGVWGGRLGVTFRDNMHDILDTLSLYGTGDEWQTAMTMLDDELDSQKAFMNLYQIFAQKSKS